ncbi:hypothetical protein [Chryseobacterium aquaticum]|uniref:Uncharacterized protein n=1 Tax=Chryseobacterium aquaticum subsp. greenlandense TaxID=345663 RepID=A0A101CI78_9FLAO|nr:hypothetical protein [Chryseobacterium aquaticum]KUJ56721.1 hypothetical protein AR686_09205 [Chryseobacterium aquaticum subsp. greenlandense]
MRNLVLNYFEEINNTIIENGDLKYCDKLNLTVDKNNEPAISRVNLATQTFTKTYDEASDSDSDRNAVLMSTQTRTFTNTESSDSDRDNRINLLMITSTITESQELTDSDK